MAELDWSQLSIDKGKPIPRYYQVSEALEKFIERNDLASGVKLPSEEHLAELFGVSRPTINKAVQLLMEKSLVRKVRGKGTFVIQKKLVPFVFMQDLTSLGESLKKSGLPFTTEVIEAKKIQASSFIAHNLMLEPGSLVVYLKRLRRVEGEPIFVGESYLSAKRFPDLLKHDLVSQTLYSILEKKYRLPIVKAKRMLRVVKPSAEDASLLEIPLSQPLIKLDGTAYSWEESVVLYSETKFRGDRVTLTSTVSYNPRTIGKSDEKHRLV
ncbi:hypothetical protein DRJ04_00960 [Candidatus Aerophobetes bacterium]|uniref:HTH gntR-type domain-containing protein n=1 Tax=Aerophobetes bacterium TaxID=2030807 RepID=A0A662DKU4_UNCAE|nr:MAG: hypothetical protein DRJ04_00960 [Candidatus Aerophobetes bacterium]